MQLQLSATGLHPLAATSRVTSSSETDEGGLSLHFSIPEGMSFRYETETNRIATVSDTTATSAETHFVREGTLSGGIRYWRDSSSLYPDGMVANLILELTQQCNMRCAYCLYSGNYDNRRNHGEVRMDFDMVVQSIRLYASLNRNRKEAHISFYGGEALLEFRTIQKAVEVAREAIANHPLKFSISTNGLLLDEDVASWLDANPDVSVLVTLNGPFHDDYRRDRFGGKTLARIHQNLSRLKRGHPVVWDKQVRFICNVIFLDQIRPLRDFYASAIGKIPLAITNVIPYHGSAFIDSLAEHDKNTREAAWMDLADEYLETGDPFLHVLFRIRLSNVHERPLYHYGVPGEVPTCKPMSGSIFVGADGNLSLCERCGILSIGTVGNGVDKAALVRIYDNAYSAFRAKCANCWAQRLCSVCLANVDGLGTGNPSIPDAFCQNERSNVLADLRLYCRMALFHADTMSRLFPKSVPKQNEESVYV